MGQKVHPTGFRIGVNQGWKTVAFSTKSSYAKDLLNDLKIREYIEEKLLVAGVASVKIRSFMNKLLIEIFAARPGVVIGRGGEGIETLKKDLNKIARKSVEVKLFEVKNPESSAKLVAEAVGAQLQKRIVPKFAAQREIEKAKTSNAIKGIKIQVAGRIKGAEIARTEKFQWGSIPLQTLRADIDFYFYDVSVPNAGKHGIKVWIYKGEKREIDD